MQSQCLNFSGSASPEASSYEDVYATIVHGAEVIDPKPQVIVYPGQLGQGSGRLNYKSAVQHALQECRNHSPSWIVARSFGCEIACSALASGEEWVRGVKGVSLWGAGLLSTYRQVWPTREAQQKEIEKHKQKGTWLAEDCLDKLPGIENLIGNVRCNVRIARGSLDDACSSDDIKLLFDIHRSQRPEFCQQLVEVSGLKHCVRKSEISAELLAQYYECLFVPFSTHH